MIWNLDLLIVLLYSIYVTKYRCSLVFMCILKSSHGIITGTILVTITKSYAMYCLLTLVRRVFFAAVRLAPELCYQRSTMSLIHT
jgi:hypothetical protein